MDDLWDRLSNEMKQFIKDALQSQLGSDNKLTMKAAATSLAIIAAIEVPDGKWDGFL